MNKSAVDDQLGEADKAALLDYLRQEHGAAQAPKNKVSLTRKQNAEIEKTDTDGRASTIQVEVHKKRVLMRNEKPVEKLNIEKEKSIASKPKNKSDQRKLRINDYASNARDFLPKYTEDALTNIRKALEAIVLDIIESQNEKPERTKKFKNLEDRLSYIRRVMTVPRRIEIHLKTLQDFGNFGSHHQEHESTPPSTVETNLRILDEVIDWHNSLDLNEVVKS